MTKWIIGIGVLVIIGVGLWWSGVFATLMGKMTPPMAEQTATTTPTTQTPPAQQPVSDLPTQSGDTSDAAIVQDTAAVDAQMQGLGTDQSNIDSSMNDKQTAQEF